MSCEDIIESMTALNCSVPQRLVLVGFDLNSNDNCLIHQYDLQLNKWLPVIKLPDGGKVHNYSTAITADGDTIYFIGGFGIESCAYSFNVVTRKFTILPDLLYPRQFAGAAVIDSRLYVAGGSRGEIVNKCMENVERYDPATGRWEEVASLTVAQDAARAFSIGGKLVLTEGFGTKGDTVDYEVYTPQTNEWISVTTPTELLNSLSAFMFTDKDRLFALLFYSKEMYMFDPNSREWFKADLELQDKSGSIRIQRSNILCIQQVEEGTVHLISSTGSIYKFCLDDKMPIEEIQTKDCQLSNSMEIHHCFVSYN